MEEVRASVERLLSNEGSLLDFEDDVVLVAQFALNQLEAPAADGAGQAERIAQLEAALEDSALAWHHGIAHVSEPPWTLETCRYERCQNAVAALAAPTAPARLVCPECVEGSTAREHFKSHTATAAPADPGAGA